MSDRTFEHTVRDWLDDGPDRTPPPAIDAVLLAVKTIPQERELRIPRRFAMPTFGRLAVAALAAVTLAGGGAIWYVGQNPIASPQTPTGSPVPRLTPSPTARPSAATSPTTKADVVKAWPSNHGSTDPGLYSWDGVTCEPKYCVVGVLHFHGPDARTNEGSVRISISRISEWSISDASGTPVNVAGHQGLYSRINPQLDEWNVDFDGTLVSITLSVEGAPDQAVVDEAFSIIESLVYEQRDTRLGFRLVFRLQSSHWDSPF